MRASERHASLPLGHVSSYIRTQRIARDQFGANALGDRRHPKTSSRLCAQRLVHRRARLTEFDLEDHLLDFDRFVTFMRFQNLFSYVSSNADQSSESIVMTDTVIKCTLKIKVVKETQFNIPTIDIRVAHGQSQPQKIYRCYAGLSGRNRMSLGGEERAGGGGRGVGHSPEINVKLCMKLFSECSKSCTSKHIGVKILYLNSSNSLAWEDLRQCLEQ
ncbi:hypothetical protein EVAR_67080_1 [Eumeta japonica]|uniref:Uncharacterized protein n=1 Tax=Eumeta variegata TaxID=151549 RepID=A0A4C2A919_EUMVA|nr:hypothetical protein EVAR_67080_1 [Eumeta japonica]